MGKFDKYEDFVKADLLGFFDGEENENDAFNENFDEDTDNIDADCDEDIDCEDFDCEDFDDYGG
jgi:hypothetical protein